MQRILLAATTLLAVSSSAFAVPITYMFEGLGDGSIGGTSFGPAAITLTVLGDTAGCELSPDPGQEIYVNDDVSTSITIGGLGTFDFTQPTGIAVDHTGSLIALARMSPPNDMLLLPDPSFATYDLISTFGPISLLPGHVELEISTTGGELRMYSFWDMTFASSTSPVVPEPASLSLLGLGLAGIALRRGKVRR